MVVQGRGGRGGAAEVVRGSLPPPSSRAEHGPILDSGAVDPAEEGLGDGGERRRKGLGMEVGRGGGRAWGWRWEAALGNGEAGRQHQWGEYMVNLNIWAGLGLLSFNLLFSFFSLLLSNYRHCCNMLLSIVASYYFLKIYILKRIHVSVFSIKCSILVSVSAGYRYTYPYPCCVVIL
jgi:hypothetical protein